MKDESVPRCRNCVLLAAGPAAAQERVTSVADLHFYSSFWMNLHHRLHADARDKKNRVDVSGRSSEDRAAWGNALEVYARELAQRDLRIGKDMTIISGRLSGAGNSLASLGPGDDHRRALEGVAPGYRARLWPEDDKRNRAWIEDVTQRLQRIGVRVLPQLEAFYRTPWYSSKRTARVDIVYVGDARGGSPPTSSDSIGAKWRSRCVAAGRCPASRPPTTRPRTSTAGTAASRAACPHR